MTAESDLSPQKITACMTGSRAALFSAWPGIILVSDRPHLSLKRTKDVPRLTYSLTHYVSKSLTQGGLYILRLLLFCIKQIITALLPTLKCYNMCTCSWVTAWQPRNIHDLYWPFLGTRVFPRAQLMRPTSDVFCDWKIYWVTYCTTNLLCLCCSGNKTHRWCQKSAFLSLLQVNLSHKKQTLK